jgi:hypothetical protein
MHYACEKGFLEFVKLLVKHQANTDKTTGGNDLTPLHFSDLKFHPTVTKYLMQTMLICFQLTRK